MLIMCYSKRMASASFGLVYFSRVLLPNEMNFESKCAMKLKDYNYLTFSGS